MDGVKSAEAIEAARKAAEANEESRASQIAEAVEIGVKPIREELEKQNKDFAEHREDVRKNRIEVQEKFETLATKDDIKEIQTFMGNVDLTFKVIRGTSTWGWKIIIGAGVLITAILAITGGLKAILAAIAGWALTK